MYVLFLTLLAGIKYECHIQHMLYVTNWLATQWWRPSWKPTEVQLPLRW